MHPDRTTRHRRLLNSTLLTLMVAGVSVAYAASLLAYVAQTLWVEIALAVVALHGLALTLCLLYARFIEPQWIAITKKTISFPLKCSLRIAVIGDFHVNEMKGEAFIAKAARRCNALRPDLVLLVGDFLFDHHSDIQPLAALGALRAKYGVYAVIGNHDSGNDHMPGHGQHVQIDRSDDIVRLLEPLGIRFLRNTSLTIEHSGETVALAGIDDLWMERCSLQNALKDIPKDMPTILLSHQPDIILDPSSHRANLIVSGHTLGGQLRLPFFGVLSRLQLRLNN